MIVMITGASSGFGAEMARKFVENNHTVIATARRLEKLENLRKELGKNLIPIQMDVTEKNSINQGLSLIPDDLKKINVLINNAGLALGLEPAHQAYLDDWETMISTNCKGLVTVTRAILPNMVKEKSGLIINIGSVAGAYPYPGGNVYGATKAFVDQFTLNLRADLVGTGIRATNLSPGLSGDTEFSNIRFKGDDFAASKVYEGTIPLSPRDIAEAAYWISSLPEHVNINSIEMMASCQGFSPFNIKRTI